MVKQYKKIINCLVILLFFMLITFFVKYYFKPFLIIVVFMFICEPIFNFLITHKIFNRKVSSLISILFVNVLIILFFYIIANTLYNKIMTFTSNEYLDIYKILNGFNSKKIIDKFNIIYNSILNNSYVKKGAVYTTDGIFSYFIGNVAAYFILADKYDILNWLKEFIPEEKILSIVKKINNLREILLIECKLIIVTTIETITGFCILGVDNALVLGLICGMLDILPYVGTILVYLPLVVTFIISKKYITAIEIGILYVLVMINRQILEAKFMSKNLEIHPLLIILSLYIGLKLFGVVGLFMGPIYVITAKEIIFQK